MPKNVIYLRRNDGGGDGCSYGRRSSSSCVGELADLAIASPDRSPWGIWIGRQVCQADAHRQQAFQVYDPHPSDPSTLDTLRVLPSITETGASTMTENATSTEQLREPRFEYRDVPLVGTQVVDLTQDPLALPDLPSTGVVVCLPSNTYVCTRRPDGDDYATCIGQVLRIATRRNGAWGETTIGVCQNRAHRDFLQNWLLHELGSVSYDRVGWDEMFARFPSLSPDQAIVRVEKVVPDTAVDLPILSSLQRRLIAYLLGGDGAAGTRAVAFQHLTEAGTFMPYTEDATVVEKLQELLEENPMGGCSDGLGRFRRAFEDVLGPSMVRARYRATLTINDGSCGEVLWTVETGDVTDLDFAEQVLHNHVSFGAIDRAVADAFISHDSSGIDADFHPDIDATISDVEYVETLTD